MRISFTPSIKSLTRRNPQWFPLQTAALVTAYQERHLQKGFFEDKTLWKWSSSDTTVTASRASPASEPQARQESQGARASIYERMSVLPFLLFYICFVSKYLLSTCYYHFYWPRRLQLSGPTTFIQWRNLKTPALRFRWTEHTEFIVNDGIAWFSLPEVSSSINLRWPMIVEFFKFLQGS